MLDPMASFGYRLTSTSSPVTDLHATGANEGDF
jgi:hypothetical protein